MKGFYLKGEERFGPILSILYSALTGIGPMRQLYAFIIEDLRDSGRASILDVGTGPGIVPIGLSKLPGVEIYAVDPSESMIRIAKSRKGNARNVHFALGSSRSIPFNRKFNIIISSLSFHHWADKERSLMYLKGLLNKGGEIRIYERQRGRGLVLPGLSSHLLDMGQAAEAAAASGLKVTSVKKRNGFICLTMKT